MERPYSVFPRVSPAETYALELVSERMKFARKSLATTLSELYQEELLPAFIHKHGRDPSLLEIRRMLQGEILYKQLGRLSMQTQDALWETAGAIVQRQITELTRQAGALRTLRGSLHLGGVEIPKHQTCIDIHRMPGGYVAESGTDDIFSGALYDLGLSIYSSGGFGKLCDALGKTALHHLQSAYPDFNPESVVVLGCSVGHSTLPYRDAFIEADIQAVDLAAPMLRYGLARANALGKEINFRQADASCTGYADESFDLVCSHLLLHESPLAVTQKIFAECRRLLRPGGLMLHIDVRPYHAVKAVPALDPFKAFMADWDHVFNGEPYWHAMRTANLGAFAEKAGFDRANIEECIVPTYIEGSAASGSNAGLTGIGQWYVLAARK